MNFKSIYEAVMNKCNIDTDDEQGIAVIKNGINEAYNEISKEEYLTSKTPIPIINGVATLPEDLLSIIKIEPALDKGDFIKGSKIFTVNEGSLTVTYSYLPEDLVNDNDEPEISLRYHKLLITYGCFSYFQFKKKDSVANSYYGAYQRGLNVFNKNDNPTSINGVFSV